MEPVRQLIEKIEAQHAAGESPAQLLNTVRQLAAALEADLPPASLSTNWGVVVMMPPGWGSARASQPPAASTPQSVDAATPASLAKKSSDAAIKSSEHPIEPAQPVPATPEPSISQAQPAIDPPLPAIESALPAVKSSEEITTSPEPSIQSFQTSIEPSASATQDSAAALPVPSPEPVTQQVGEQPKPATYSIKPPTIQTPEARPELPFNALEDVPTLAQQAPPVAREVHELHMPGESLNDKLKREEKELAQKLTDTPIKDLRRGIGINDRYLFLSELFRGDEAMYERSIKTINAFHILAEAEYWINRELKVKLAWDDSTDTVQHFYGLVRRRFS